MTHYDEYEIEYWFDVRLMLTTEVGIENFQAFSTQVPLDLDGRIEGLFGRDLLANCRLEYDGPNNQFSLYF